MPEDTSTLSDPNYFRGPSDSEELSAEEIAEAFDEVFGATMVEINNERREMEETTGEKFRAATRSEVINQMFMDAVEPSEGELTRAQEITYIFLRSQELVMDDIISALFNQDTLDVVKDREVILANKVANATLNQRFAAGIFLATKTEEGSQERLRVKELFEVAEVLSNMERNIGDYIMTVLNGARAQAACMEIFEQAGYRVVVPDPENKEEIEDWDVLNGGDFVVIDESRNLVVFFDAKGRSFAKVAGRSVERDVCEITDREVKDLDQQRRLAKRTIRTLQEMGYNITDRAIFKQKVITLPTMVKHLDLGGRLANEEHERAILAHFEALA